MAAVFLPSTGLSTVLDPRTARQGCGLVPLLDLLCVTLHQEVVEVWIGEKSFLASLVQVGGVPDVVVMVDPLVFLAEDVVHHGLIVLVPQDAIVLIHSTPRFFPWLWGFGADFLQVDPAWRGKVTGNAP